MVVKYLARTEQTIHDQKLKIASLEAVLLSGMSSDELYEVNCWRHDSGKRNLSWILSINQ